MLELDELEDLFDDLSIDGPTANQLEIMYNYYLNDIVRNPIFIEGRPLKYNKNKSSHPICRGKHQCFEHIITRGSNYTKKRYFDRERANKIHWIRPIIENVADSRIKYFEAINDEGENQQFFWYEEKMFIVIVRELNPNLLLITSFTVDKSEKRKYREQYLKYIE